MSRVTPRVPDIDLTPEETRRLAQMIAEADAVREEIGVAGPEVAAYNVREAKLRLAERRLLDANVLLRRLQREHEEHPVTRKIWAYYERKRLAGSGGTRC